MASTLRRVVAAAGASALMAGAAIVVAPSAHADGEYYGTWTLTAYKENDQKTKCTDDASDTGACPTGETLTLKSNYRYKVSKYLRLFLMGVSGKGNFAVDTFPSTGRNVLVLDSDKTGVLALGGAWSLTLAGGGSGSPTKMTLVLQTGFGEITLILRRDSA